MVILAVEHDRSLCGCRTLKFNSCNNLSSSARICDYSAVCQFEY